MWSAKSSKQSGGPYRKPRADIYTILLIIALIALLLGILCLYFEMGMYDFDLKGGPTVSAERLTVAGIVSAIAGRQRLPG